MKQLIDTLMHCTRFRVLLLKRRFLKGANFQLLFFWK